MRSGKLGTWFRGHSGPLCKAEPFLSSFWTLTFLRLVSEPVSRGARGSVPAGVPGRPEPLPQLPEMPEPSSGESHSPHLPQPQVVGLTLWASKILYTLSGPPGSLALAQCWMPCLRSEPVAFLPSTAGISCRRCHRTSASCPFECLSSATTS